MRIKIFSILVLGAALGLAGFILFGQPLEQATLPAGTSQPLQEEVVESPVSEQLAETPLTVVTFIAQADGSVESLMQQRADIVYTSKQYPTMGSFLDSLQGVRNANGKYWMLSINGTVSPVGMSQAQVSKGDTIVWTYE